MVASSFRQTGLTESRAHAASMPCSQSGKPSVSLAVLSRLVLAHKPMLAHTDTQFNTHAYTNPEYRHSTEQADHLCCLLVHQCGANHWFT